MLIREYSNADKSELLSFSLPLKFGKDEVIANCMMNFIMHPAVRGKSWGARISISWNP